MTLRRLRVAATLAVAAMVLVAVLVVLLGHDGPTQQGDGNAMVPAPLATGNPVEGARRLPDVSLRDEYGDRTSLRAFAGRWVVLVPCTTQPGATCPIEAAVLTRLSALLRRAGLSAHVVVAEVSVDPTVDTPVRLRAYKQATGADFAMLTGATKQVATLWNALGVSVQRNAPDELFIVDPAGAESVAVTGTPQLEAGERLRSSLRRMLDADGVRDLADPRDPWTARQLLDDLDWSMGREVPASSLGRTKAPSLAEAMSELRGSPRALGVLHEQAGELLGSIAALKRRLRSLRGRPVVVNAWASWCPPCREEFPLLAAASAEFGRRVAFLGVDTDDDAGKARSFLHQHPVSYPSYEGKSSELAFLRPVDGLPSTFFINASGRLSYVRTGQFEAAGTLDADIERYALGEHKPGGEPDGG